MPDTMKSHSHVIDVMCTSQIPHQLQSRVSECGVILTGGYSVNVSHVGGSDVECREEHILSRQVL